jgi:guanylate cyclase
VGALLDWLARLGALPTDTPEERLRRAIAVLTAALIGSLSTVWVATYGALGLWLPAAIPLTYQVASAVGLVHLWVTKRAAVFRRTQLAMFLLLPFLLQWSLGGFVASSAVMLWAFWAPVGQLMYEGGRSSLPWFAAYMALTGLSGLLDPTLAVRAAAIPSVVRLAFFVLNVGAVSGTTYALLRHFADQRERALAALDREHRLLQEEQERSEGLLLNILPAPIAARLKQNPGAIADGFNEVTVLFADIVDFTRTSAGMAPQALVAWLNDLFTEFDRLADRHGLEKIKTVGDAYMVVGGLPAPRPDHVQAVADMALDMQALVAARRTPGGEPLRMRIGIHTGPVVAGVIGVRKFIYDLWGDTVNTASRMESHGLAGGIQVTEPVYERLRDTFRFGERRTVEVKGKGPMATYLLLGRRGGPPGPPR